MVGVAGFAVLPAAAYGEQSNAVTSVRSFPGVIEGGERLFAEASSVSVEDDIDWGGVESLDVPQTKSQTEKDAEAAQKRAEEEAKRQAEQQAAAAATASRSSSTAAASRSEVRTSSDSGLAGGASLDYSIAPAGFNPNHEIGMSATVTLAATAPGGRMSAATSWVCPWVRSSATARSGPPPPAPWATGSTARRAWLATSWSSRAARRGPPGVRPCGDRRGDLCGRQRARLRDGLRICRRVLLQPCVLRYRQLPVHSLLIRRRRPMSIMGCGRVPQ